MKDYNFFIDYQKKKGATINVKSPYFIGAVILLIVGAISCGLLVANQLMVQKIEDLKQEAAAVTASEDFIEASRLKESIDAMNQYERSAAAIQKKFDESNVIGTDLIKAITAKVPSTVSMSSFDMDNAGANFRFNVPNRKAAAELLLSLKDTGLFQEVALNSITPGSEETGGLIAEISTVMKAGEAE